MDSQRGLRAGMWHVYFAYILSHIPFSMGLQRLEDLAFLETNFLQNDSRSGSTSGSLLLKYYSQVQGLDYERELEERPKVSGLKRRVKRFGCWKSCLGPPMTYKEPEFCREGSACACLIDLLGKIHGVSCSAGGRLPLNSRNSLNKPIRPEEYVTF